MIIQSNIEKLKELRLFKMAQCLEEQEKSEHYLSLSFSDRLGLLLDLEKEERENKQLKTRLKNAQLRQEASLEGIEFSKTRNLDKKLILSLNSCEWIKKGYNLLLSGATGVGKSYLACALGNKACLEGYKVKYLKSSRFFTELYQSRGDGSFLQKIQKLEKFHLLILDDWGLSSLQEQERKDFLEVLDDRHQKHSTIISSQIPLDKWHEIIGDPTYADAILDRFIHNAYRIELRGESYRKKKSPLKS